MNKIILLSFSLLLTACNSRNAVVEPDPVSSAELISSSVELSSSSAVVVLSKMSREDVYARFHVTPESKASADTIMNLLAGYFADTTNLKVLYQLDSILSSSPLWSPYYTGKPGGEQSLEPTSTIPIVSFCDLPDSMESRFVQVKYDTDAERWANNNAMEKDTNTYFSESGVPILEHNWLFTFGDVISSGSLYRCFHNGIQVYYTVGNYLYTLNPRRIAIFPGIDSTMVWPDTNAHWVGSPTAITATEIMAQHGVSVGTVDSADAVIALLADTSTARQWIPSNPWAFCKYPDQMFVKRGFRLPQIALSLYDSIPRALSSVQNYVDSTGNIVQFASGNIVTWDSLTTADSQDSVVCQNGNYQITIQNDFTIISHLYCYPASTACYQEIDWKFSNPM